jgi:rRNA maturation RNase YbeY
MKKKTKHEIDKVTVINLLPRFKFPHIVAKNILLNVLEHFNCKPDNINIIFMGDGDIKRINSKFLSHNYPTDVISFKLNDRPMDGLTPSLLDGANADIPNGERGKVSSKTYRTCEGYPDKIGDTIRQNSGHEVAIKNIALEAELYIGVEEVRRNSLFYKTKFYQELKRVIIHGALHLVGFKDSTPTQRDEMRSWEDHFLDN